MRAKILWSGLCLAALVLPRALPASPQGQRQKKDYLTQLEADKIRDAENSSERIKLFLTFAADRIKKLQYELAHPSADRRRAEVLNGLVNDYSGCMDDAADLIELGIEKQEDVRGGVKEMQSKGKEFLAYLKGLSANGPELQTYKDNLDDAVEATQDALKDAEKAAKEVAPPPVRRRP